jgi:hypothetical protein
MKTAEIASSLCLDQWQACASDILPPWIEGCAAEEARIKEIWLQIRTLRRQRDELKEMWPAKADQFDREYRTLVTKLAEKTKEYMNEVLH